MAGFFFNNDDNDPTSLSPSTIDRRRRLAEALMTQGTSTAPIKHWTEGAARLVNALSGSYQASKLDKQESTARREASDQTSQLMKAWMGGGDSPAPAAASVPGAGTARDGTQPSEAMTTADATGRRGQGGVGDFNSTMARTFEFEGGLNRRDTNGTPSNFGINQKANPDVDVLGLTQDKAKDLYKARYWDTIGGDNLPPAVAHVAFDTSVIAGPGKAKELLAASGGDPMKLLDLRKQFQDSLIARDPAKYGPYARAWENRLAGLRADVAAGGGGAPTAYAALPTMNDAGSAPLTAPRPMPVEASPLSPTGSPDAPMAGRAMMNGATPIAPGNGFSGASTEPRMRVAQILSGDGAQSAAAGPRASDPGSRAIARALMSPAPMGQPAQQSGQATPARLAAILNGNPQQTPSGASPGGQVSAAVSGFQPGGGQAAAGSQQPSNGMPSGMTGSGIPATQAGALGISTGGGRDYSQANGGVMPVGAPSGQAPSPMGQGGAMGGNSRAALPIAMQIMQNEHATPAQRQIAGMILQKAMSSGEVKPVDLGDRIALINSGGQVTGYLPKQRDAADWEAIKDANGNTVGRFNRRSGASEQLPTPIGGSAKAPTVQRVKQQDGSEVAVQWDDKQNAWIPLHAPAGGNPVPSTLPKLTEGQSKDVGFYQRGIEANKALTPEAEKALTNAPDTVLQNVPSVLGINPGRALQSPEFKTAHNSARNFLAVILRKDTGAAITSDEWKEYTPLFIPQPNDTPDLLTQKRQARETAMQAIKDGLGNVGAIVERVMAERKPASAATGSAASPAAGAAPVRVGSPDEARRLPKGTKIILPDGREGVVP